MVKLGPDVQNGNADAYSGYLPEGTSPELEARRNTVL